MNGLENSHKLELPPQLLLITSFCNCETQLNFCLKSHNLIFSDCSLFFNLKNISIPEHSRACCNAHPVIFLVQFHRIFGV